MQYTNPGQALQDLLGGAVPMSFAPLSWVEPHVRSKALRGIAVSGAHRALLARDIPTFAEAGYPDVTVVSWFGVVLPSGTSKEVSDRLHRELARILEQPDMRERLAAMGMTIEGGSSERFGAYIGAEKIRLGKLIETAKIRVE